MHLLSCGRTGNIFHAGRVFRHGDAVLAVLNSTWQNSYGHKGGTVCPIDDCRRTVAIHARPATEDETAAFLEEETARKARKEWSDALIAKRRAEYLARKASK